MGEVWLGLPGTGYALHGFAHKSPSESRLEERLLIQNQISGAGRGHLLHLLILEMQESGYKREDLALDGRITTADRIKTLIHYLNS